MKAAAFGFLLREYQRSSAICSVAPSPSRTPQHPNALLVFPNMFRSKPCALGSFACGTKCLPSSSETGTTTETRMVPQHGTLQRAGRCKRRVCPAAASAWNRGKRTYLRLCLRGSWRRWRGLLCRAPLSPITGKTLGVEMFDSTICFLFLTPRFTTEMIFDTTAAAQAALVPAPPAPTRAPQGRVWEGGLILTLTSMQHIITSLGQE